MPISNFSYTILDASGNQSAIQVYFDSTGKTLAQMQTYSDALEAALDAVLDGQIVKQRVIVELSPATGIKAEPNANSVIQRGALYSIEALDTPYDFSFFFPAWLPAAFSGKQVDRSNSDVVTFEATLLTATATIAATDKYGNLLNTVEEARERFRKYRKQQERS